VLLLAAASGACASRQGKSSVDLQPARAAVQKARDAGAAEKAPQELGRAEDRLKEAEATLPKRPQAAACLADLVVAEAECASRVSSLQVEVDRLPEVQKEAAEADRLSGRLKKAEEDQKRLEERVAVLMRDLELTETEVIRTKARLQGLETKADATSVMAETRVLIRRQQEQRGRTPALVRSQELLDRSEQMVDEGNFGAATFLALKAQELIKDVRRVAEDSADRPAPKRQYTVTVASANLRKDPVRTAAVVGRVKKGDVLEASLQHGDWLQVKAGNVNGWVFRELVE
jgi:hypothetical protein